MSLVTHTNEACHTFKTDVIDTPTSHGTHTNKPWHTYAGVMSDIEWCHDAFPCVL